MDERAEGAGMGATAPHHIGMTEGAAGTVVRVQWEEGERSDSFGPFPARRHAATVVAVLEAGGDPDALPEAHEWIFSAQAADWLCLTCETSTDGCSFDDDAYDLTSTEVDR